MYEVGRAGAFVSEQKWRRRAGGALHAAAAVLSAVIAVGCLVIMALADMPVLRALAAATGAFALAGCLYGWTRSRQGLRRAGQAAVGARSEREVRAAVRRTRSFAAAYGLVLGARGGDCDVVVFTGGGGAAAIEVKTGHGVVTVVGDTMRVGQRELQKSPARQAANQARLLSRKLDRKAVLAVVCVPGMTNRPFTTSKGVWVCSAGDLAMVLDHAPRVFDSAVEARGTMDGLWHAGTTVDS